MAIPTDPSTLAALSTCYRCIPEGDRGQVLIYILAQAAGLGDITAKALMEAARCYCGIPEGDQQGIFDYLMTQIANGGGSPVTCEALEGSGSPVGSETPGFVGQLYTDTDGPTYWKSTGLTNANWEELSTGGGGLITLTPDNSQPFQQLFAVDASLTSSDDPLPGTTGISIAHESCPFITISEAHGITSFAAPNLVELTDGPVDVGYSIVFEAPTALTSVSFPLLDTCANPIYFNAADSLTSLIFPSLVSIPNSSGWESFTLTNMISLTTFSAPNFLPEDGSNFTIVGAPLTAATVNHILARHVANAGYVSGIIELSGAAPTGQGIVDKATLQGRGVTVNTN